jgi:hypothetical protein
MEFAFDKSNNLKNAPSASWLCNDSLKTHSNDKLHTSNEGIVPVR